LARAAAAWALTVASSSASSSATRASVSAISVSIAAISWCLARNSASSSSDRVVALLGLGRVEQRLAGFTAAVAALVGGAQLVHEPLDHLVHDG
jgi:hypothetical protein